MEVKKNSFRCQSVVQVSMKFKFDTSVGPGERTDTVGDRRHYTIGKCQNNFQSNQIFLKKSANHLNPINIRNDVKCPSQDTKSPKFSHLACSSSENIHFIII